MKVVITTDCFLPRWDGVARFLSLLLPQLKDWDITVFAPRFPGVEPTFSAKIVRFPLMNIRFGDIYFSKPNSREMARVIREANVVFNQTLGPIGRLGILLGQKYKKRVVSYVHSIDWELAQRAVKFGQHITHSFIRLYARSMYNKCSLLLVPSKKVADALSENKVMTRKDLVSLGVNTDVFVPPKNKSVAKRKLGINGKKLVIGFCGRIAREKNLSTLLAAFRIIKPKYRNAVLLIIGEGLESEIPGQEDVLRAGVQQDVVPFLQAMDVFVLPSLTETSSLATMEAMSCALPVVVTPVGSIPEYVVHGENGLLFAREDVSELAELLDSLLARKNRRLLLGAAARKTMMKKYSWDAVAQRIRNALMF